MTPIGKQPGKKKSSEYIYKKSAAAVRRVFIANVQDSRNQGGEGKRIDKMPWVGLKNGEEGIPSVERKGC